MADIAINGLLGGLRAAIFLRKYWQKKPLLVRQAVAGFQGLLSRAELFALAGRDDVESRLVSHARGRWTLAQGPFRAADLKSLPWRAGRCCVRESFSTFPRPTPCCVASRSFHTHASMT